MIDGNNGKIKKLIDPKSGFTLYIRKFDNTTISQVSTLDSFPVPQSLPYSTDIMNNVDDVKKEIQSMQQQTKQTMESMQNAIVQLNKQNAILLKLMVILFFVMLTSVFL